MTRFDRALPSGRDLPTACVIGAGSSGIAAAKKLNDAGIPFDCFEKSDRVGGNWVFGNKNRMSSAYRSLHINTSRDRMEYADFPMPRDYPDFPHHAQIARYFDDYVDHFGFRDRITFETGVHKAELESDGAWHITLDSGETHKYDSLLVANGHHWDARWPEPPFPGEFDGVEMHAHHYVDNGDMRDKNVVVLGMGNSAMDIAVEASQVANKVFLAARRGAHVIPKYLFGRPLDQMGLSPRVPWPVRQKVLEGIIRTTTGPMERYGLPKPDHRIGEAHPTISSEILSRPAHGEREPGPPLPRRYHPEAERPAARGRQHPLRGRHHREGRRRRLLHGLQGHVPVLRRELPVGARQRPAAVPARLPPRHRERLLHRSPPAARRDHAAGGGAGRVDRGVPARRLRTAAWTRAASRHRARAPQDVQALRRVEAAHDAGRLRRLPARPRERAEAGPRAGTARRQAAARATAGGRRGHRPSARLMPPPAPAPAAPGRRERTKAANRAAILDAARDVFAEHGYDGG